MWGLKLKIVSLLALVIWRLGMFINPSNKICCKLLWFLKIVITNLRQSFWGVLNKFGFFYWFMDSIDLIFLIYMFSLHIHTSKINIKKRKGKKFEKIYEIGFFSPILPSKEMLLLYLFSMKLIWIFFFNLFIMIMHWFFWNCFVII